MKKFSCFLFLMCISENVLAIPVVNENRANSGMVTIYPDHADSHRYYIAPNVVTVSRNEDGVPNFVYSEFRKGIVSIRGVMQMTMMPSYTRADLEIAKAEILQKDPLAQFSGLPFISSELEFTGEVPELIESHRCNHAGGLIGQEQSCTMTLTSKGRRFFLTALQSGTLFTTLQFAYSVDAAIRLSDGSFRDQMLKHEIAVRIDGSMFKDYPKLIRSYGL